MPSAKVAITIEQGSTFKMPIEVLEKSGNNYVAKDLTGWDARGHVRELYFSPATLAEFDVAGDMDTTGKFSMEITATETAAIAKTAGVYDIEIFNTSTSEVIRLVEGAVTITPEVTK